MDWNALLAIGVIGGLTVLLSYLYLRNAEYEASQTLELLYVPQPKPPPEPEVEIYDPGYFFKYGKSGYRLSPTEIVWRLKWYLWTHRN